MASQSPEEISNDQSILPSKNSSVQLPCMSLHLISMLVYTTKEVRPAVYIEHNPFPRVIIPLSLLVITSHLNPFRLHLTPRPPPLPPCLAPDSLNAMRAQLLLYRFCGFRDVLVGNRDLVKLDPSRMRNPLRSEALDLFDGMVRRVEEELADQMDTFVVGDVRRGLLRETFAIEVLGRRTVLVKSTAGQGRSLPSILTCARNVWTTAGVTAPATVAVLNTISSRLVVPGNNTRRLVSSLATRIFEPSSNNRNTIN
jgi:hypothetical protein